MVDFDPDAESSYIVPLDVVSLYAYCMQQPLPISDYRMLTPQECQQFDVGRDICADRELGYMLEVAAPRYAKTK
jgi:hypothetical protein